MNSNNYHFEVRSLIQDSGSKSNKWTKELLWGREYTIIVIALVPGLFTGGKPDETCCHSVVASKWLKTQSVCSAGRNTAT